MPLEVGTTLGVYEVLAAIGAGGMGEVYKARDTKLDRDVALKILPDAFVNDPERLARFQREAKVLASLNHPNIAAIYGLEESGDSPALVLEYVPGPTLQDRIAKGPIPLDEALPIARQIAEALEAAHEQGIIHRDLKPANVKVKDDGTVKVLDFGLAKALQPELSDLDAANSPTMTMTAAATKMGVIMGTAAYMSPEQARGKTVDKRADIWAFGVVLFEMLTGRQAFGGTDISETLAAVLKTDLDLDGLPADTPRALRRALSRCIQKDRSHRSRDIGDVRLDLDEALAAPIEETVTTAPLAQPALWQRPVPLALTALLLVGVSVLIAWNLRTPPPRLVTRFSMVLPAGQQLTTPQGRQTVALSPDGTRVAYITNNELYLRPMNEEAATLMRGTDGARSVVFSPDGQWIAFVQGGQLKKVAVTGGASVTVCEVGNPRGVSCEADDTIFFTGIDGIHRVSADGGTPELVVDTTDAIDNGPAPQLLPGGQALLFALRPPGANFDQSQIVAQRLDTGEQHVLLEGGTSPRYVSTGHVVYAQGGTLFAVPFDLDKLEVTGGPVSLVEGVRQSGNTGNAYFSVSQTGSLVYVPDRGTRNLRTLVWVDREGQEEAVAAEPRNYVYPRISGAERP